MLHIGIVAGESSGDQLGAALIKALRERHSHLRITGMAGPKMLATGCEPIATVDELSVMGLAEVLSNYPRLRQLRDRVCQYYLDTPPDVFVGIDVPDFTLNIEARLHKRGIKTAHYVAPQIWAWRQSRARKLSRHLDLLLALFPFEEEFFRDFGVPVKLVGHPIADQIPIMRDTVSARRRLGLEQNKRYVALMPGSRRQEWHRLVDVFLRAAVSVAQTHPDIHFVAGAINRAAMAHIRARAQAICPGLALSVEQGVPHDVLSACDAAIVASGTVTMEALFTKTPVVVAYKLAPLTHAIMKRLVKVPYIAMPNVLAQEELVPEFVQGEVTPAALAGAVRAWLENTQKRDDFVRRASNIHGSLRLGAATTAADAILRLAADSEA